MLDFSENRRRTLRRRGVCLFVGLVALALAGTWSWFFAVAPAQEHFTLYFSSSVHGLSVGAPVQMNGQDIGRVSDIRIVHVPSEDIRKSYYAAVTVSVSDKIFETGEIPSSGSLSRKLPELIRLGLRGQLRMPSLLANGLCVSLYFNPGQPVNYINPAHAPFPEIPTNYKSTSDLVDQANTFIETKNLYALAEKIRSVREQINAVSATARLLDANALNRKLLHSLEQANRALDTTRILPELAELNAAVSGLCQSLETSGNVPARQTELLLRKIQNLTRILQEIRTAAQTLGNDFSGDADASPARWLKTLRNHCRPLIDFGKNIFL